MSDLVAIAYDSLDTAQQVAANASQAQKAHLIDLEAWSSSSASRTAR